MSREFSLGFKTPNWSSYAIGVSKPLTDARIRYYIRAGHYGESVVLRKPKHKISAAVARDRAVRKLTEEYDNL